MKKLDFTKGSDSIKQVANKAGKKISGVAKDGSQAFSVKTQEMKEKSQEKSYEARIKKYNPLFPEKYQDVSFNLPNMIRIVDDAVRKNIDVCEGAIGWLSKEKNMEVLHLYDEKIGFSGLTFLPTPACDAVYYVDPHDRKTFINIDSYFSTMQQAKLAELQHIAHSLGAKKYWVEMIETTNDVSNSKVSVKAKAQGLTAGVDEQLNKSASTNSQAVASAEFIGVRKPIAPTLCWFANDNNMLNLINMRCSGNEDEGLASYNFELSNSSVRAMSSSTAVKIDAAIKGMGASTNFNSESVKESNRRLVLHIDF